MTSTELLVCILLVFCSAFLAASEIALFSLTRFQLRSFKENFRPIHRKMKRLLGDPSGLLITILAVNEVLNIALSSFITEIVSRSSLSANFHIAILPDWATQTFLGVIITAPIVLLFCEVTPKVIAAKANQLVALLTVSTLTLIYDLLKPVRILLKIVIRLIRLERTSNSSIQPDAVLKESEFLLMLEEGHKEGAIQEKELDLIRSVFELDHTTAEEISTPLSQVLSLPIHTTVNGALSTVRNRRYSRIPIIGVNRMDVVGILYPKDLLRSKLQTESTSDSVASFMRKPFFVHPTMKLNALFRRFKQNKIHMAIVKTAQGEVIGVVTMNDILDALFENLVSEGT